MSHVKPVVMTVGHSNHALDSFVRLLQKYEVEAVADVRSVPYSRHHPQFSRPSLEHSLREQGIAYIFLGRELGARVADPSCYENGRVRYTRIAQTAIFRAGVDRVIQTAEKKRIALMCAEREPLDCHRTLLVSKALANLGVRVKHILADGCLATHQEVMEGLLKFPQQEDLFRSKEERLAEAATLQEEQIAYVLREAGGEKIR